MGAAVKELTDAEVFGSKELSDADVFGTPEAEPSTLDKIGRQVGLTARAGVEGALAIPGMGADAINHILNLGIDAYNKVTGSNVRPQMMTGELLDKGLTAAGLPSPATPTERVVSDVNKAVSGQGALAAGGRVLANSIGPVASRMGELLKSGPGMQMTSAAAGAGAGGVTREIGGGPGAQLAANLAATVAVPAVAGSFRRNPLPAETQAIMDEAKRRDVDLSYSDITGQGRRLDTMLEQAPVVGTSKFREAGAKKATAAMEGFADDAKTAMQNTEFRGLDRLTTAAQSGDKSAQNTLDQIQNAGEDWTKIMQASGNLKLWRARQDANQLYGKVEAIANTRGQVPLSNTTAALDAAIAEEGASKLPDPALLGVLKKMKGALAGEAQTIDSPILGADGKPVWSKTINKTDNSFSGIRQLRSDIGDLVESYYKGANAAVGAKGVGKLQAVKNAVEGDMESFATTNGGDLQRAWKRADEFYKLAVVPYKDKALASALKSDLPDEIYRKFVQVSRSGAGEDRAQKFYNALDQKGRSAVRYGMIANALDAASIPEKQGLLSPGKFEQSISNISNASGVFFKGAEKDELDGFVNLMEHARRFGQFTENPPTGQRVIPWLALGGAALRPGTMAGVGGAALTARLLITTEAGKRFLLDASSLRAGTPAMSKLVDRISQQLPRLSSQSEAQSNKEPRTPRSPPQLEASSK